MLIKPKMAAAALVSLILLGCSRQGEISTAGVTVLDGCNVQIHQ